MSRLRITKLTVSHPYIQKCLEEYGKDHDQEIMKCVQLESKRMHQKFVKLEEKPQVAVSEQALVEAETSVDQLKNNAWDNIMGSWQKLKDEGMEHLSQKEVKHPSSLLTVSNDEYTTSSIEITVIQE